MYNDFLQKIYSNPIEYQDYFLTKPLDEEEITTLEPKGEPDKTLTFEITTEKFTTLLNERENYVHNI